MIENAYIVKNSKKHNNIIILSMFFCFIGILLPLFNLSFLFLLVSIIILLLNYYNRKEEIYSSNKSKVILKDLIIKDTNNELYIIKIKSNIIIRFVSLICILMLVILFSIENNFYYIVFYLAFFIMNIKELINKKREFKLYQNIELLNQVIAKNKSNNIVYKVICTNKINEGIYNLKLININNKDNIVENIFEINPNYEKYEELIKNLEILKYNNEYLNNNQ